MAILLLIILALKKTTFKKIDLTKKADVKTVAAGVAAVKKWHKTHPTKGK